MVHGCRCTLIKLHSQFHAILKINLTTITKKGNFMQRNLNYPELNSPPPYNPEWSNQERFKNVPQEIDSHFRGGYEEIAKVGMQNHEARVCLILDVSASMQQPNQFFKDDQNRNRVQELINKSLALAFIFDDNQQIEVFPFGDKAYGPVILSRENFTQATDLIMDCIGGDLLTATNYAAAVKKVRDYYFHDVTVRKKPQACDEPPVFAIFVTDGEPNREKTEAINQFASASHQAIFFKFLALKGKQEDLEFTYLSNLDNHDVKEGNNSDDNDADRFYIDNSNLVVLKDPNQLTMNELIQEYREWLVEAHQKKILSHDPKVKVNDIRDEGRVVAKSSIQGIFNQGSSEKKKKQDNKKDDDQKCHFWPFRKK